MPRFLSPDWLAAFATALAQAPVTTVDEPFEPFTVHVSVTDPPDGCVAGYSVAVAADGLRLVPAPADDPGDVVLQASEPTFAALQRGDRSAQEALERGELAVRGRLEHVRAARKALATLTDVGRSLRDESSG